VVWLRAAAATRASAHSKAMSTTTTTPALRYHDIKNSVTISSINKLSFDPSQQHLHLRTDLFFSTQSNVPLISKIKQYALSIAKLYCEKVKNEVQSL